MEKTYKVTMYEYQDDSRFRKLPARLYSSLELIELVKSQFDENVSTIEDARQVISMNNGYAREVIVELTNDDFIGNIKPDGTMTKRLDLGSFMLKVPRSEDLVANFDKLTIEQQKVICALIDKAEQVRNQINKQYDENTSYALINKTAKDILDKFVRKMFTTDDRPNPDAQIMNMLKFNGINIETLFDFLSDTVNDMPVSDLMTDDFGTLSMHTDEFWRKIVVEVAHNSQKGTQMPIFTKADIEIETFHESTKKSAYVSKLYEYLDELKSQDIYVVDVSLISTTEENSSYYGDKIYNEYMIRLVKPKYEVIVETYHFDELSDKFYHVRTETLGYFKSVDEIENIKQQYQTKSNTDVKFKIKTHYYSPLMQSIQKGTSQ